MLCLSEKDAGIGTKIQSRKFEFEMKPQFEVEPSFVVESRSELENNENSSLDDEQAPTHTLLDENSCDDRVDDDPAQHTLTFENNPPRIISWLEINLEAR